MDAVLHVANDVSISGCSCLLFFHKDFFLNPIACHKSKLAGLGLHQIHFMKLRSKKEAGCAKPADLKPTVGPWLPEDYTEDGEDL